ncbi:peptidase S41 [Clostridium sartagoforme]|uniref:Peptidase S41 n=1 Tax=Clostridium sartagoforme TaxID=84031 RepID=A0A4S2DHB9_9CLOT|nr:MULTISPECIES: S41 family peptidase [Clostridium]MBS5938046.1 S41 family peptidase [Clostridium sp.]TGY41497.1 peptidase S41 [Clostridium sartagoforme]
MKKIFKGKIKRKHLLVLLLLISVLSLIGYKSINIFKSTLTQEEKVEDFLYMYDVIEKSYPYLEVNKRVNNVDWLANKENYLARIKKTKNDANFIKELNNILADLNNNHTHVISDSSFFEIVTNAYDRLGWYDFFDDEIVKKRYESIGKIEFNKKTFSTEDLILKDIVEEKVGYIFLPEMTPRGESIEENISITSEYIKTLENHESIVIDIRGNSGGNDAYWEEVISRIIPKSYNTSGYILFRDSAIINNYVKSRDINTKDIKDLPKEIVNNGPVEITSKFKSFTKSDWIVESKDSINFKGDIYLLVDKVVFSAAESFSIFCKENGIATLIGETTAGDGGGYDPVLFKLKNSGLIVRMASDMYLTNSGICNEEFKTTPDYIIENPKRTKNFSDDKCINKVLELVE